jgi:hypothetical protein
MYVFLSNAKSDDELQRGVFYLTKKCYFKLLKKYQDKKRSEILILKKPMEAIEPLDIFTCRQKRSDQTQNRNFEGQKRVPDLPFWGLRGNNKP